MQKYFLLLIVFLSFHLFYGQKDSIVLNPRCIHKTGYDFNFLGPSPFLSFSVNHFINEKVNLEAGLGVLGAYGGIHFFSSKKEKKSLFAPYTGINLGFMTLPDIEVGIGGSSDGWGKFMTFYIPAGVQLMTMNGFHLSIEGAMFAFTGYNSKVMPWGSLKIGQNF
ncbi:MAG: hypothetical protein FJZ66_08145 [Bacteroidetes bacterium]|nr:hypothetical protein [Bacteroidota bacterium]